MRSKLKFLSTIFISVFSLLAHSALFAATIPYGFAAESHRLYKNFKFTQIFAAGRIFPSGSIGYYIQPKAGAIIPQEDFNESKPLVGARIGFFAPKRFSMYVGGNFSDDLRWSEVGVGWGERISLNLDYNIFGAPNKGAATRIIGDFRGRVGYWITDWAQTGYFARSLSSGTSDFVSERVVPFPGGLFLKLNFGPIIFDFLWQRQRVSFTDRQRETDNSFSFAGQIIIGKISGDEDDDE